MVLLPCGAVLLPLLLLLDDAALHAAEAGFALPSPADARRGQRLGELLHHQWQQMGRERLHAGCHAWTVAEMTQKQCEGNKFSFFFPFYVEVGATAFLPPLVETEDH